MARFEILGLEGKTETKNTKPCFGLIIDFGGVSNIWTGKGVIVGSWGCRKGKTLKLRVKYLTVLLLLVNNLICGKKRQAHPILLFQA